MNDSFNMFQAVCQDDEFEHQNQIFSLDYRTVSGDVSLPENAFRTQDFLPHGKQNSRTKPINTINKHFGNNPKGNNFPFS